MTNALEKICADKRAHIKQRKSRRPLSELVGAAERATPTRGFADALIKASSTGYGLVSEIKRASPSKGLIRNDFDPAMLARAYQAGGATCLSVLTDAPYFQGSDDHLMAARAVVNLPVLRKDFMLDPYQIIESRALGADCILLIMAALDDQMAAELEAVARGHGMDVLIEVHDDAELERALRLKSPLIGINNRNLKTLKTDISTTVKLAGKIPADRILVCESGLNTPEDLAEMARAGARCFLIGEALMRQDDVEQAVRHMLANPVAAQQALETQP
ncbi:MAG: indole-3-glycerol phosphate synthase TrpC [Rhodospirillaceae bacterium]|jgi:indole-3-glycerol phosphate synthase|nr:indole-3-glycerol phosphate synthase TrpC [Rhodospirillaceae bacterium]